MNRGNEGSWFVIGLGLLVICMLWIAMWFAAKPQSRQHQWLAGRAPQPTNPQQAQLSLEPEDSRSTPSVENTTKVKCETTAGTLLIEVHHDWAPLGARRFLKMVNEGFFDTRVALFRAVENFLCQTGIAGDPQVQRQWRARGVIPDDPQWLTGPKPMRRGYLSFAGSGPNTRSTEFFFAFRDLQLGRSPWEVPFAQLVGESSYHTLDAFYVGYGDLPVFGGQAPRQGLMYQQGLRYLEPNFPSLDYIDKCDVIPRPSTGTAY